MKNAAFFIAFLCAGTGILKTQGHAGSGGDDNVNDGVKPEFYKACIDKKGQYNGGPAEEGRQGAACLKEGKVQEGNLCHPQTGSGNEGSGSRAESVENAAHDFRFPEFFRMEYTMEMTMMAGAVKDRVV